MADLPGIVAADDRRVEPGKWLNIRTTSADDILAAAAQYSRTPEPTRPTVGDGQRMVEIKSATPGIEWLHTPQINDDYVLVFIGLTIPDTVPGGSSWTNVLMYGDQKLPLIKQTLVSGQAGTSGDQTRGHVEVYGAPIPRDASRTPKKVSLAYKTGMVDAYTLRGNSVTLSGVANGSTVISFAGFSNTTNETRKGSYGVPLHARLVGCSEVATKGATLEVGANNIHVLWSDGTRPFTIWTAAGCGPSTDVTMTASGLSTGTNYRVGTTGVILPSKVTA